VGPVVERLRSPGVNVEVLVGGTADETGRLARRAVAEGLDVLVALGGDGLVSLAHQSVAGTDVRLGIVPCGTGNDAARALGLPLGDPVAAADVVLSGRTRVVDLGRADGRTFLAVLSSGFDSRVNERANRMTRVKGPVRYRLAMLAELGTFRPVPYRLVLDGEPLDVEAMLVAVGNGPSYGGGMRVCPGRTSPTACWRSPWCCPWPSRRSCGCSRRCTGASTCTLRRSAPSGCARCRWQPRA
jgi:diacylglycerol kinase (ATP)